MTDRATGSSLNRVVDEEQTLELRLADERGQRRHQRRRRGRGSGHGTGVEATDAREHLLGICPEKYNLETGTRDFYNDE